MKRFLIAVCIVAVIFSVVASAKEEITVFVDDQRIEFDVSPAIVDSRTIVPLRAIFEALGATVEWDGATSTCTAKRGDDTVKLTVGEDVMYVNGEGKKLDVTAMLVNDRTMVPLRAVSEAFDCKVTWYPMTRTAAVLSDYENKTMLFSYDGRSRAFPNEMVEAQLTVGWYREPLKLLYASDGRSKYFVESDIAPQLTVGWFLWSGLVCDMANYCVYIGDYEAALSDWLIPEMNLYGDNEKDDSCYIQLKTKRDSVLEIMRDKYGVPYSVDDFVFTSHSDPSDCGWISNSSFKFWFYNVEQKDVVSFEFRYTCYDTNGKVVKSQLNGSAKQSATVNALLAPGESQYVEHYFNGYPMLSKVDFEIVSIKYSDGSVWKK